MTTNLLKPEPDVELGEVANAFRVPCLELRDVAKTFRTAGTVVPAVKAIDLSIGAGETVALLGPQQRRQIDDDRHAARPDPARLLLAGARQPHRRRRPGVDCQWLDRDRRLGQ